MVITLVTMKIKIYTCTQQFQILVICAKNGKLACVRVKQWSFFTLNGPAAGQPQLLLQPTSRLQWIHILRTKNKTKMHSSRMRIDRALTVFPGGGGGGGTPWTDHLPHCEQTDACENITFPLRMRSVTIEKYMDNISRFAYYKKYVGNKF